jgi:cytosine/adenosine deaminase-related metal-dependent hydrolase
MSQVPTTTALRARWIVPMDGPAISHGVIVLSGGRITAVASDLARARRHHHDPLPELVDLGNVAILPGLVNAHAHLEFSDCRVPLGQPGMSFPDWIRQVIQWRRSIPRTKADVAQAVTLGIQELARTGTTTVGEIATGDWPADTIEAAQSIAGVTAFLELIGLAPERIADNLARAQHHLSRPRAVGSWRPALSPHAPYTVHPQLLAAAVDLALPTGAPLAMHLAESPEELELLATATGPFRRLLDDLGAWHPDAIPLGTTPLDYLTALSRAPRSLIIHGNYLSDDEFAFLAAHRQRMALIYCPRTHHYFGHRPYRLPEILARGVHVAIGTDGRGSNPDLDLLAELRFVAHIYPTLAPHQVLELGTRAAAQALGLSEIGTLTPGKIADLAIIALADPNATDPAAAILDPASRVVATYRRGERVDPIKVLTTGNS